MGISVQWDDDDKTIVLITFDPEWTWNDVQDIDAQATALYESATQTVDIIADVRMNRLVTTGMLSYIRNILTMQWHPHAGAVVVVGVSSGVRALFDAAALVARKPLERFQFAQTLDEARTLIKRRRAKR